MCECGCGGQTQGGQFIPGHDQKLRAKLEGSVGGLLPLRDLIAATAKYANGATGTEELTAAIRRIFAARR